MSNLLRRLATVSTLPLLAAGASCVLASENPCKSIQKLISTELCPSNPIAASSPLVCPAT